MKYSVLKAYDVLFQAGPFDVLLLCCFSTVVISMVCLSLPLFQEAEHSSSTSAIWCASFVLVKYFHLSTFFWMFVEGKKVLGTIQKAARVRKRGSGLKTKFRFLFIPVRAECQPTVWLDWLVRVFLLFCAELYSSLELSLIHI